MAFFDRESVKTFHAHPHCGVSESVIRSLSRWLVWPIVQVIEPAQG